MSEETRPTEADLRYYYFGLYTVLRRYRAMTVLGWIIVLLGLGSIPLGWRLGTPHGMVDTLLSIATMVAGLAVVQQSVTALSSYLHVPFHDRPSRPASQDEPPVAPSAPRGSSTESGRRPDSVGTGGASDRHPAILYIEELMRDIDNGGWQDAYEAIEKLEKMPDTYGLPQVTSTGSERISDS